MRSLGNGLFLALALLLAAASTARADLTVCSTGCDESNLIDSSRTWTKAVYRVQEDIQVRTGALTLEPGVMLQFTAPEMGLRVEGTLIARGTEEKPITFTSGRASPGTGGPSSSRRRRSGQASTGRGSTSAEVSRRALRGP